MNGYRIVTRWSEEERAYIAEAPELPGCAADGETLAQALESIEVVVTEWIETARRLGRSFPEPRRFTR